MRHSCARVICLLCLAFSLALEAQGTLTVSAFSQRKSNAAPGDPGRSLVCPAHDRLMISWTSAGLPSTTFLKADLILNGIAKYHIWENRPLSKGSDMWTEMGYGGGGASGSGWKVRLSTMDGKVTAETDTTLEFGHTKPTLTIVSPTQGSQWVMGERQTIRWVTTGCTNMSASPFIALFLQSAQADLTYMHGDPNGGKIAEVAPDQHSYDWVVGAVWGGKILQPAEGFKVQVPGILFNPTATEQYDPNRTTLGGAFRIWPEGTSQATIQQAQAAMNHTIRLISPFGNEVWEAGRVHDIQWVWNGPRKPNVTVSLYLYKGTANLGLIVGGISASTGHFAWTIPTTFAGKLQPFGKGYAIQVVVDALPTVNSKSPKPFSISRPILRSGRP